MAKKKKEEFKRFKVNEKEITIASRNTYEEACDFVMTLPIDRIPKCSIEDQGKIE